MYLKMFYVLKKDDLITYVNLQFLFTRNNKKCRFHRLWTHVHFTQNVLVSSIIIKFSNSNSLQGNVTLTSIDILQYAKQRNLRGPVLAIEHLVLVVPPHLPKLSVFCHCVQCYYTKYLSTPLCTLCN